MNERDNKAKPRLSNDKLTVDYNIKDFSKNLPNISKEINQKNHPSKIPIESVHFEDEVPTDPDLVDFIRRCSKIEDAFEIIEYLRLRGEVQTSEAERCIKLLKNDGLDAFGEHKEKGYYERKFRHNRRFREL